MDPKDFKTERDIKFNAYDAFIIVDIQNDFIPGGALPVDGGNEIIQDINYISLNIKKENGKVILTQDWHPKSHKSFASNHEGKNPGDEYSTSNGSIGPVLWPDHCVQGTKGAEFHKDLDIILADAIIRTGGNPLIDSYSGFLENDRKSETGLAGYLRSLNIQRIFISGLALDYCCAYTAIDGIDFGFNVYFFVDLTRGIDQPSGNISNALKNMKEKGVKFLNKDSIM